MPVPRHCLLAAAVGLGIVPGLRAEEPGRLDVDRSRPAQAAPAPSPNQKTANQIAEALRQSGPLQGCKIDIVFREGVAELIGFVPDQPRHEEALRIAQGVPGVERVRDRITLMAAASPVVPAQAAAPAPGPVPMPRLAAPPEGIPPPNGMALPPPGALTPFTPSGEPLPIAGGGPISPYALTNPAMPPYAWPTYAPYNNYSRVAYPQGYPCNAWPFIGPMYPFPKVPLGWRSVKLEWADGHWYMGQTATWHDWWRVRYW